MRIIFVGTVEFSLKSLEKLISLNAEIVGVLTKEKSPFNSDYKDLTFICKKYKIPFKFVENINEQVNIDWMKSLRPDIIFCFGWSSLLKKDILSLAPMGVIGFHPAKLPQNRGRHPLIWALALGLEKSATTFFFMDEGADSGDILSQVEFDIKYEDDAKSIYIKVVNIALKQIEEFLHHLINKNFTTIKQKHSLANYWRKRGKDDGKIDFRMSSNAIYNLVRALTKPYIGAHIEYNQKDIKIWKVKEEEYNLKNIEFGKILEISNNTILIKCYDNAIRIIEHEFKVLPKVGEYI